MILRLLAPALATMAPALAMAQPGPGATVAAPSGQMLTLEEVLSEQDPWSEDVLVVVRLLAPAIAQGVPDDADLRADMDWACLTWGVPAAAALASNPDRVVVEMMAAPVPRGEATPGIRRFFETYSLEGATCIWELF
jgi:hypothetical protein